jgi:hypothetical protein
MVKQNKKVRRARGKERTVSEMFAAIPRNTKMFLLWILILAVVFVAFYYLFNNIFSPGTVKYEGLTFTVEKIGELQIYHYAYIYKNKTGNLIENNIYLQENPAKNKVPISGNITFISDKTIYIGIDTDNIASCGDAGVALAELSGFLKNGGLPIKGGSLNRTFATEINSTYVNCSIQNINLNPVINVKIGNSTGIYNKGLCYNIEAASCTDLLPAVEKFIVKSIVEAKAKTTTELADTTKIPNATV